MRSNEVVLIVLLIILILAVVYSQKNESICKKKGSFTSSTVMSPYVPLHMQDAAIRGARHDAYGQDHAYKKSDLARNYKSWSSDTRDIEEAQRAAWFEAVSYGTGSYNSEAGGDKAAESIEHHTSSPSINYQDTLVDLISDPRMREQHKNWHSEVAPKSHTALKVDTLDEAAAVATQGGHGLYSFRFPAPSQHNPMFITDQDAKTFGVQTTEFSFGG